MSVVAMPVIVTDAAGSTDLVQDNGLVVPAGDVGALSIALARLMTDDDLRRRMGRRSLEIISAYTVEAASDAFWQTIDKVYQRWVI